LPIKKIDWEQKIVGIDIDWEENWEKMKKNKI